MLVALTFVLGLLVGSFLNVVIYRLPVMMQRDWRAQCHEFLELELPAAEQDAEAFNLQKPDSHCPKCKHKIRPWENIPVLSYLALRGKCSQCKTSISPRYPSVEFITGLMSALVALSFGATWLTLALLLLTWSLIVLTLIDYDQQLLPDSITLPLLWLGLVVNTLDLGFGVSLRDAVIGAAAGYLLLWGFYWAFKLATGKEGMGFGDFKLLAALGAWMGWQALLPILILSSLVGAVFGILLITLGGHDRARPMPFGPYLAGAGYIMLIWGQQIYTLYFNAVLA